jgi:hypothetical protein
MSGRPVVIIKLQATMPGGPETISQLQAMMCELQELGVSVTAAVQSTAWLCNICGLLSHNPHDSVNEYCGCCGNDELPRVCSHRKALAN